MDEISLCCSVAALLLSALAWRRAAKAEEDVRMWRRIHANWLNGGRRR